MMDAKEENILQCYERLRCEVDEEMISNETIEELKSLDILVMNVCESHLIETRLAHPPTDHQKEALAHLGVILGNQKFTEEEDKIIKQNWKRFKKEYGYDNPKLFMHAYLRNSERLHFVQYLGQGLPRRTLYSIYGRFQRLYNAVNDGPFTPQEDLLIALHVKMYKGLDTFSVLAKLLNRDRIAVFKRHNYIMTNERTDNRKWTMKSIETLLKNLVEITKMDLEKFRTETISWYTWLEIEKRTGYPAGAMKSLWHRKLYAQLYSAQPIYMFKMKSYLVKRLHKTRVENWQRINWNDIAEDFDGINSLFLWSVMNRMLRKFFPDYRRRNVREMMKFLRNNYIKRLKGKDLDYRLQRIWLKSGKLVSREENGSLEAVQDVSIEENGFQEEVLDVSIEENGYPKEVQEGVNLQLQSKEESLSQPDKVK